MSDENVKNETLEEEKTKKELKQEKKEEKKALKKVDELEKEVSDLKENLPIKKKMIGRISIMKLMLIYLIPEGKLKKKAMNSKNMLTKAY